MERRVTTYSRYSISANVNSIKNMEADPGVSKIGPSLAGVVGRKSGSAAGYDYSSAMTNANITWDDETLDKFLAGPAAVVHGTKMFFSVPNSADRENVIAYLGT
jgi:cytochrome c